MRPLPEQCRDLIDALALGGGKKADLAAAGLQLHDGQCLGLLGARQLVGLGQHDQKFQSLFHPWPHDIEQDLVELGQTVAWIAHQHDGAQVLACHQVVGHHLLPADLVLLGHGGVAIARQVGQHRVGHALFTQGKQVDVLRPPWFLGGKGQLLLLRQGVDAGGLSGVGASHKGNLGHAERRQEVQLGCSGQKFGGVQPARSDQGGSGSRVGGGSSGAARRWFGVDSHSVEGRTQDRIVESHCSAHLTRHSP